MPTGPELWKRVEETFDIVLDSKGCLTYLTYEKLANSADRIQTGCVYLSESVPPKHAPQFPNDLAHAPLGKRFSIHPRILIMTSALLLLDHRPWPMMAVSDGGLGLRRLDGHIDITDKFPFACGGYADIYPGILRGDRNIAVRTVHVYAVPPPDSRITSCIKVAVKVFRDVHHEAQTPRAREKYTKASQ